MAVKINGCKVFIPRDPADRNCWVRDITAKTRVVMPVAIPGGFDDCFNSDLDPFSTPVSFFTGPKGIGKSTLLLLKRDLIEGADRDGDLPFKDIKCLPDGIASKAFGAQSNSATDSLQFTDPNLLGQYSEGVMWEYVWIFIFSLYIIQAEIDRQAASRAIGAGKKNEDGRESSSHRTASVTPEICIPPEARKLINLGEGKRVDGNDFWRYLKRIILESGATKARLHEIYENHLLELVRQSVMPTRFCIFLDAIDEHLKDEHDERLLRSVHYALTQNSPRAPEGQLDPMVRNYDVWANAQTSLMGAASKLHSDSNHRVKLYSSLRSEAYHSTRGWVAEQQRGEYCGQIFYDQHILKVIVQANILVEETKRNGKLIKSGRDQQDMLDQLVATSVADFFGADANNVNDAGKRETWIDCMIRHTMERPRELMLIGHMIGKDKCPSFAAMTPEQKLRVIQSPVRTIVTDFLDFLGVKMRWSDLELILEHVSSNVLTLQELQNIASMVSRESDGELQHPFCRLHSMGLLGSIDVSDTGTPVQHFDFHAVDLHGNLEGNLPMTSPLFLLHPLLHCVAKGLPKKHAYLADAKIFVGNGLPWKDSNSMSKIVVSDEAGGVRVVFNGKPIIGRNSANELDALRDVKDRKELARARRFEVPRLRATVFLLTCIVAMSRNKTSKVSRNEFFLELGKLTGAGIVQRMLPNEKTWTQGGPNKKHRYPGQIEASRTREGAESKVKTRPHTNETMQAIWDELHNDAYVMTEIRSHLRAHVGNHVLLTFVQGTVDREFHAEIHSTGFSGGDVSIVGFDEALA